MSTHMERRIVFDYGPKGMDQPFRGEVHGFKTWDELEAEITDERWGSPYTVIQREERRVEFGVWDTVSERTVQRQRDGRRGRFLRTKERPPL